MDEFVGNVYKQTTFRVQTLVGCYIVVVNVVNVVVVVVVVNVVVNVVVISYKLML